MKYFSQISFLLLTIMCFSTCELFKEYDSDDVIVNNVMVEINHDSSRSVISPDIDWTIDSINIIGTMDDLSVESESLEDVIIFSGLTAGSWTFIATAKDSNDVVILEGSTVIEVKPLEDSTATITLAPLTSTGTLNLSLQWESNKVNDPTYSIDLIDSLGNSIDLNITYTDQTINVIKEVPAGYYTVSAVLFNFDDAGGQDIPISGFTKNIRVISGQLLEIDENFENIIKIGDMVEVTGSDFTIEWDYDGITPEYFQVMYRNRGSGDWLWVDLGQTTDGSIKEYTVIHNTPLDYGIYEFAVKAVVFVGIESELHSTLDSEADPVTGWYVNWTEL